MPVCCNGKTIIVLSMAQVQLHNESCVGIVAMATRTSSVIRLCQAT
jgi:hypothetical protein